MDAVTYTESKVITFVNQHFIPLRLASDEEPYKEEFNMDDYRSKLIFSW